MADGTEIKAKIVFETDGIGGVSSGSKGGESKSTKSLGKISRFLDSGLVKRFLFSKAGIGIGAAAVGIGVTANALAEKTTEETVLELNKERDKRNELQEALNTGAITQEEYNDLIKEVRTPLLDFIKGVNTSGNTLDFITSAGKSLIDVFNALASAGENASNSLMTINRRGTQNISSRVAVPNPKTSDDILTNLTTSEYDRNQPETRQSIDTSSVTKPMSFFNNVSPGQSSSDSKFTP